ncbi:MAG: winged helix-turn-helix domain-containing protein [Woeseiaceae bacterium]|nr:winged helix-turn-helix domain-containing protein [Woeseiaceae bacterium]
MRIGDWIFAPELNRITDADGENVTELEPLGSRLLQTLAEHPGRVFSNDELVEAVWKGRIVSDNPVYKLVANLRRVLGDDSSSPQYIETIRKRGYRLVAPVEILENASDSEVDTLPAVRSSRAVVLAGAALAVVAAVLLVIVLAPRPAGVDALADSTAIAVLPFVDMSPDGDKAYLGDGLSEEIIHSLTSHSEFPIIGRTSSFAFGGDNQDLRDIGQQLGARYILEGSVRQWDDQIRVTAQLIDAYDGVHLWSHQFDRGFDDILSIQSDIAARILESVSTEVGGGAPVPGALTDAPASVQVAAYDAYLRGRQALALNTATSAALAETEFLRALELQPDMLGAITGLVRSQWLLVFHSQKTGEEAYAIVQPLAERALVLAPDRAATHIALAEAAQLNTEWERSNHSLETAIQLEPNNAAALSTYAYTLSLQYRHEEAKVIFDRVLQLEPASAILALTAGMNAEAVGSFGCADGLYRRALRLKPELMNAQFAFGSYAWRIQRDFETGERHLRSAAEMDPDGPITPVFLALAYLESGRVEEAGEWIAAIESASMQSFYPVFGRLAHAVFVGEEEKAREAATAMLAFAYEPNAYRTLRDWHLREGRISEALAVYPDWLKDDDLLWVTRRHVRAAADLAYVLQQAGEDELARRMAEKVLEVSAEAPRLGLNGFHFADVTATLVLEDEAAAFARLEQAYADGQRALAWWELDHNMAFEALRALPEFEGLRERFATSVPDLAALTAGDQCAITL